MTDRQNAKPAKQEVRLPQRSDKVAGEKKGKKPIAAAQEKNQTVQSAKPQNLKAEQ